MTDQKQAPERDLVKWWIDNQAPPDVVEAFEALAKQRGELAAENERLNHLLKGSKLACTAWEQLRNDERARAEKAEAERDQSLAASAAREIAMRERGDSHD